ACALPISERHDNIITRTNHHACRHLVVIGLRQCERDEHTHHFALKHMTFWPLCGYFGCHMFRYGLRRAEPGQNEGKAPRFIPDRSDTVTPRKARATTASCGTATSPAKGGDVGRCSRLDLGKAEAQPRPKTYRKDNQYEILRRYSRYCRYS